MTPVRMAIAADEMVGVAPLLIDALGERGVQVVARHGMLGSEQPADWARCCAAAARDVADGRADQAIVCCWTGTGASMAANKIAGVRAALCADAVTAHGARRWNDANVLALSLRSTSTALLGEILDAWLAGIPSGQESDRSSIAHLSELEGR